MKNYLFIYNYSFLLYKIYMTEKKNGPVSWDCTPLTSDLDMTLNNLIVRLQ